MARFCASGTPEQEQTGFGGKMLRHVERAGATSSGTFHDVEVNHGGGDIGVPEEVLHGSDVDAVFEQMSRNTRAAARS